MRLANLFLFGCIIINTLAFNQSWAEDICLSETQVVDLITLLDASDKDISRLERCGVLLVELKGQLNKVMAINEDLIGQLAEAKQDVIRYQDRVDTWRKVTWYSCLLSITLIAVEVLPAVL